MQEKQQMIIEAFKKRAESISSYTVKDDRIRFTQARPDGNFALSGFDHSDWQDIKLPFTWDTRDDAWFRKKIVVPEHIEDIPVEGSQLRIRGRSVWDNPVLNMHTVVYLDGKESVTADNYMDFSFIHRVPGRVKTADEHVLAIHTRGKEGVVAFFSALPLIEVHFSNIDTIVFELESFAQELIYAQSLPRGQQVTARALKGVTFQKIMEAGADQLLDMIKDIRRRMARLKKEAKKYTVHLIGHAHIDMNWLWPMEETVDVCKNTFTTVDSLMERYKDFRFSQSQAYTYQKIEQEYPRLFERIKQRYEQGRWDITASSWVEMDLNLSNEEAIVRQILMAKKYIGDKFGFDPRVFWAPDTFGHPWSMPQILKKCGIDYYYFMRASKREHDLFWWEGRTGPGC
ncbi:MAG: hypothetical protein U5N58_05235 [Actinomycetota bacterium]|nr:hypothetical protein [Actinomycetota bacterium]